MSGLDKHFGSDASLDAATAREISGFLEQNAGGEKFVQSHQGQAGIAHHRNPLVQEQA